MEHRGDAVFGTSLLTEEAKDSGGVVRGAGGAWAPPVLYVLTPQLPPGSVGQVSRCRVRILVANYDFLRSDSEPKALELKTVNI